MSQKQADALLHHRLNLTIPYLVKMIRGAMSELYEYQCHKDKLVASAVGKELDKGSQEVLEAALSQMDSGIRRNQSRISFFGDMKICAEVLRDHHMSMKDGYTPDADVVPEFIDLREYQSVVHHAEEISRSIITSVQDPTAKSVSTKDIARIHGLALLIYTHRKLQMPQ